MKSRWSDSVECCLNVALVAARLGASGRTFEFHNFFEPNPGIDITRNRTKVTAAERMALKRWERCKIRLKNWGIHLESIIVTRYDKDLKKTFTKYQLKSEISDPPLNFNKNSVVDRALYILWRCEDNNGRVAMRDVFNVFCPSANDLYSRSAKSNALSAIKNLKHLLEVMSLCGAGRYPHQFLNARIDGTDIVIDGPRIWYPNKRRCNQYILEAART